MITVETINSCFNLLDQKEWEREIKALLLEKTEQGYSPSVNEIGEFTSGQLLHFLIEKVKFEPSGQSKEEKNLRHFFSNPENAKYLDCQHEGLTLLARIIKSNTRQFHHDTIVAALAIKESAALFSIVRSRSASASDLSSTPPHPQRQKPPTKNLLWFLVHLNFSENSQEIVKAAQNLLSQGLRLDFDEVSVREKLLLPESIKSGLTATICLYYARNLGEVTPISQLILQADLLKNESIESNAPSAFSSGKASESIDELQDAYAAPLPQSPSPFRAIISEAEPDHDLIFSLFKDLITEMFENGLINQVSIDRKESLPHFLLRKKMQSESKALQEDDFSIDEGYAQRLWTNCIAPRKCLLKLTPEMFGFKEKGGSLLHLIVKTRNSALFDAAIEVIENSQDPVAIYRCQNLRGQTAFHLACEIGCDSVIAYFTQECQIDKQDLQILLNQTDKKGDAPLNSAVKNGFRNSCTLLLESNLVDIESSQSLARPLCLACKENKEGITKLLLQKGANPKGVTRYQEQGRFLTTDALQQAIRQENLDNVSILVCYGVLDNETQEGLEEYQQFKSSSQEREQALNQAEQELRQQRIRAATLEQERLHLIRRQVKSALREQDIAPSIVGAMEMQIAQGSYEGAWELYKTTRRIQNVLSQQGALGIDAQVAQLMQQQAQQGNYEGAWQTYLDSQNAPDITDAATGTDAVAQATFTPSAPIPIPGAGNKSTFSPSSIAQKPKTSPRGNSKQQRQ